jgi:hypothetical protein
VDPTGSDLDEEQDVERLKEGGLDREEVTGQDPLPPARAGTRSRRARLLGELARSRFA